MTLITGTQCRVVGIALLNVGDMAHYGNRLVYKSGKGGTIAVMTGYRTD